jgi:hypothetical protein
MPCKRSKVGASRGESGGETTRGAPGTAARSRAISSRSFATNASASWSSLRARRSRRGVSAAASRASRQSVGSLSVRHRTALARSSGVGPSISMRWSAAWTRSRGSSVSGSGENPIAGLPCQAACATDSSLSRPPPRVRERSSALMNSTHLSPQRRCPRPPPADSASSWLRSRQAELAIPVHSADGVRTTANFPGPPKIPDEAGVAASARDSISLATSKAGSSRRGGSSSSVTDSPGRSGARSSVSPGEAELPEGGSFPASPQVGSTSLTQCLLRRHDGQPKGGADFREAMEPNADRPGEGEAHWSGPFAALSLQ